MAMEPHRATRSLSVVIPALNEQGNIQGSIDSVTAAAEQHFGEYEIIVVNDGSTDGTLQIVQACMATNPRILVISHDRPWGFGASYHDGRRQATKSYVTMVHGDNAFDPGTLTAFFAHVGEADIICGYFVNPEGRSWSRRIISALYTAGMNVLFLMDLKYFNGLQVHQAAWLEQVDLKSEGFGFQAELLIKAIKGGQSYLEVPTVQRERPGGGETKIFKLKNVRSVILTVADLFLWNVRRVLATAGS